MNPGLLNLRIRIERKGTITDDLGQPVEGWTVAGRCRARGMAPRDRGQAEIADRETERRGKIFRVRSQPFLGFYQPGDRLVEEVRTDLAETVWKVTGWTEVDGTNGMYLDIAADTPESRQPVAASPHVCPTPGEIDGGDADDLASAEISGGTA